MAGQLHVRPAAVPVTGPSLANPRASAGVATAVATYDPNAGYSFRSRAYDVMVHTDAEVAKFVVQRYPVLYGVLFSGLVLLFLYGAVKLWRMDILTKSSKR